ncbi:DUF2075 domain-containing protein [Mucilaginibacter terrenus]|uniref:DUF2075 domain-containing protein n=1 Tax=Mucilaginibacter terrenus TaxID=2482727 RepID=A0A3E2NNT5_9SPHI|nr:DEAD/DEAH box helicase [Mucilaginibacter terrenus]RFZ82623.1 DUF2075 domain-containing protein [Mucilaginibacter terrenus]
MPTNLNTEQKAAFKAIQKFLAHPSANVFVLQGYAGTGKTFLMQELAKWLKQEAQEFCMLASTGRAATVLKGKTGFTARTVHSEVYNFSEIGGLDEEAVRGGSAMADNQLSLQFAIRTADEDTRLYIIDEASMLSGDTQTNSNFATFGSGNVLQDLFAAAGKNKIIFVGDPCQLPPVGSSLSPALDVNWLNMQDKIALSVRLQKIERTVAGNDILKLAGSIRQMFDEGVYELYPKIPASGHSNVKLFASDEDLLKHYYTTYSNSGPAETLAIARTNWKVQEINRFMRQQIYGDAYVPLQLNEVLLVSQNNLKVPLTNGDFVRVTELLETSQREGLKFQKVKVKTFLSDTEYTLLLSLDALHSLKGELTQEQSQSLMMDFSYRMRAKNISPRSADFRNAMLADEYYNCLKATFGYAVTCHKAQGGEWKNVYLFLDNDKNGMYRMPPADLCKWWYTSVTRARETLHLVKHWWVK